MKCSICGEEIEYCDDCQTTFELGETLFCGNEIAREHLCVNCMSYEEGEVEK